MHKLPVFATAREVFAFVLRDAGPILRLSWFPLLIVTVISYFATRASLEGVREVFSGNTLTVRESGFSLWEVVNNLATIVGTAMVAVALHRVILFGDRQPGTYVNLSLGKVEGLFILLPVLGVVAVGALMMLLAGLQPAPMAVLVFCLAVIGIFLVVRFSLLFPIAVVERRYNFGVAWELSRGNFWRLLGLWFTVMIVPTLVIGLIQMQMLSGLRFSPGSTTGMAAVIDDMEAMLMRVVVLSYPASILFGALGVGVMSYSYKVLTGRSYDETVPPA